MTGDILKGTPVSSYQPSDEIRDLTKNVQRDYNAGEEILNRPWEELNNHSVVDRMNMDQRTFNSFVDESTEDPHEAWKWRGTRSLARNKTMAMHAHLTSQVIVPMIFAQNEAQQADRDTADLMHDVIEWMTKNSNYVPSFTLASMGALVNPVTYLEADYCEVYQTVKERTDTGYDKAEILDEVLSGFQCRVRSATEILISNAYEQNIQKQRTVIKRRYVEYSELEATYGKHENWQYLHPGIKSIFNGDDGLFYDVKDDDHPFLCEETTWLNRRDDSEVCFLNGIYFGKDDVEWNPMRHRDNRNAPKYDLVPFGYERINEHFFFFKSLVNRVGWDNQLIDAMYEVQMNREFLDLEAPMVYNGFDNVDTSTIFPGAWITTNNPNAKASPLLPQSSGNGYRAMKEIEDSMSASSMNETQMGGLPEASQKAYSVAQAAQNAKVLLSGASKSIGEAVVQFGKLMVDIAINHLTTAQLDELTGDMKYRSFLLNDQIVNGKKVSKRIRFDQAMIGRNMSEDERKTKTMKMLSETGYPDHHEELYFVNPHAFSKMDYFVYMEPGMMLPKNEEFEKATMERLYTLLRQDPFIDPESLVRKLLHPYFRSDAEELMAKNPQQIMGGQQMAMAGAGGMPQKPGAPQPPSLPALPKNIGQVPS